MFLLLGVGYRTGKYLAPENDAIHDKLAVYQGLYSHLGEVFHAKS